jgi:hypothetical protein
MHNPFTKLDPRANKARCSPPESTFRPMLIVCGKIKSSKACGTQLVLSGPSSATYTDPNTLLPVKTDYTGRAQLTVTCPLTEVNAEN